MVVFVLVLLSDVLGVEVFLLAPTASGDDGAGPRFCASLPTSSPRFRQNWKGWERSGEKGLIISDNQAET